MTKTEQLELVEPVQLMHQMFEFDRLIYQERTLPYFAALSLDDLYNTPLGFFNEKGVFTGWFRAVTGALFELHCFSGIKSKRQLLDNISEDETSV